MSRLPLKLEFVETSSQSDLTTELRRLFADTFVFYLKAHGYHWNVEGPDFGPFHALFETVSSEVYGTIDTLAEHLRKLDAYTPYTLTSLQKYRSIGDTPLTDGSPLPMVRDLLDANEAILSQIAAVKRLASEPAETTGPLGTEFTQPNLANYMDERRDAHQKHGWFLRATLK